MSLYKNISNDTAKKQDFLAHRPLDRILFALAGKKQTLAAFVLILVAFGVLYGGIQGYQSYSQEKAAKLLSNGALEDVVKQYPHSLSAQVARVRLGKRSLDAAQYEDALKLYQEVVESKKATGLLRVAALQNMALVYYRQSQWDSALEVLKKASEDKENVSSDYTKLLTARVLEAKGDTAQAKETYKGLSEEAKEGAIKNEAKERLSWFDAGKK